MTANSTNNTLLGFSKGSIGVCDGTGKIVQQAAPASGYVLTGSSSSSTGLTSVALPSSTGAVIPNYYSHGVVKWANSRTATVPNYYVADSTNSVYIGNSSQTTLDCNKINVDGGFAVSSALPGTVTCFANILSGTGTSFTSSFKIGDTVYLPSYGISRKITAINNDTEIFCDLNDNYSFADWYVGTAAPTLSTAQVKFGNSSLYCNGAQTADMYFYFSSNASHQYEFTVESNFYLSSLPTSSNNAILFSGLSSYSYSIYVNSSGKLFLNISSNGTSYDISNATTGTTQITATTWQHVALTYYFGVYTVWLNGKAEIVVNSTTAPISTFMNQFRLGANEGTSNSYLTGYVDETRISSCCRYLAAFSPPTAAFSPDLYTLALNHWDGTNGATDLNISEVMRPTPVRWDATYYNAPTLVTAQAKFGSYSMSFNGTNGVLINTGLTQGISVAQSCFEFFFMPTAVATNSTILDSGYGSYYYNINIASSKLTYTIGNNGTSGNIATGTGTTTLANGTWYHVALTYDGSTYRLFVNGALNASTASTTAPSPFCFRQFAFGCALGKTAGTAGYFDEIRFSKTARYTAAFTTPTAAFTADSNTVLLNHCEGPSNNALFLQDGEVMGATTYARGGLARNTHYYPYAISNGTTSQLRLSTRCVSAGDTLVDLPSGYSYYRQMKFALTTNPGSNLITFSMSGTQVTYFYNDDVGTPIGFAGTFTIGSALTATAFSALSCTNVIPKISQEALICSYIWNNTTTDSAVKVRSTGSVSPNGTTVCQATSQYINGQVTKTTAHVNDAYISLSSGQQFDYRVTTSGCQCGFLVKGYKITEL